MNVQVRQPIASIEYGAVIRSSVAAPQPAQVLIRQMQAAHIPGLVRLQRLNFPTLAAQELIDEAQYQQFRDVFPEGQFVALAHVDGRSVLVGSTTTFRTDFDFSHSQHSFLDMIGPDFPSHYRACGDWLYGVDLNIHPQYRGLGIGTRLYAARQALARRLNLRGEVAGAMIPGYERYEQQLTVAQYVLEVTQSRLYDPTLSMQLRNGFQVRGILYNYLSDERSHHAAALIVRPNPNYHTL